MPKNFPAQPQPDVLGTEWDKAQAELSINEIAAPALKEVLNSKASGRKPNEKGSRHEEREDIVSGRDRHKTSKRDAIVAAVSDIADSSIQTSRNPANMLGAKYAVAPK